MCVLPVPALTYHAGDPVPALDHMQRRFLLFFGKTVQAIGFPRKRRVAPVPVHRKLQHGDFRIERLLRGGHALTFRVFRNHAAMFADTGNVLRQHGTDAVAQRLGLEPLFRNGGRPLEGMFQRIINGIFCDDRLIPVARAPGCRSDLAQRFCFLCCKPCLPFFPQRVPGRVLLMFPDARTDPMLALAVGDALFRRLRLDLIAPL